MKEKNRKIRRFFVTAVLVVGLFNFFAISAYAEPSSPDMPVKRGMVGDEVTKLQNKLKEYGYYKDSVDGRYGSGTLAAVIQFQMDAGLQPDGRGGSGDLGSFEKFPRRQFNQSRTGGFPQGADSFEHGPATNGRALCMGRQITRRF